MKDEKRLFTRASNASTRCTNFKLKRVDLDWIQGRTFVYAVGGEVLEQLPREAVDAPSLEVFKAGLDGALGSLGWY